uniref:Ig-like domain-containing protein n=1 Tax=Oreochromis aureus TaxID=47969 RepID=A0AAZ1XP73_OREAU
KYVIQPVCGSLLLVLLLVRQPATEKRKNITAESGQDVTLTCRAPNNNIIVVEWSRCDQKGQYVLLYRDDQFVPDDQHPSFKNRVDLQDRQMKDGDVSLILKDVTINDAGKYECRVHPSFKNRVDLQDRQMKDGDVSLILKDVTINDTGIYRCRIVEGVRQHMKLINNITLSVVDGCVGLIVALPVSAVLLVAVVVGYWIYQKHKQQQSQDSFQPAVELQPV